MAARETSSTQPRTGGATALWLLFGPVVWGAHFTLLYGAHTLICAVRGAAAGRMVTLIVVIATVAALVALAVPFARALRLSRQPPSESTALSGFIRSATVWLLILSTIAVIWAGATVLVVSACGGSS
jgi:hypothetical protein